METSLDSPTDSVTSTTTSVEGTSACGSSSHRSRNKPRLSALDISRSSAVTGLGQAIENDVYLCFGSTSTTQVPPIHTDSPNGSIETPKSSRSSFFSPRSRNSSLDSLSGNEDSHTDREAISPDCSPPNFSPTSTKRQLVSVREMIQRSVSRDEFSVDNSTGSPTASKVKHLGELAAYQCTHSRTHVRIY